MDIPGFTLLLQDFGDYCPDFVAEVESLLALGSEQVPFGVYAIEKDGQAEMRLDHCKSITQLKRLIRQFKAAGYKVYANGR